MHKELWSCHRNRWVDQTILAGSRTAGLKSRYNARGIKRGRSQKDQGNENEHEYLKAS